MCVREPRTNVDREALDFFGLTHQRLAGDGEGVAGRRAIEEAGLQGFFKAGDASAQGRVVHAELMRSRHKTASPHYGQERAQIVPIEFRHGCENLQIGIALASIYRLADARQSAFNKADTPQWEDLERAVLAILGGEMLRRAYANRSPPGRPLFRIARRPSYEPVIEARRPRRGWQTRTRRRHRC